MGQVHPGLVRCHPEIPLRSQTGRSCEKGKKGRKLSSLLHNLTFCCLSKKCLSNSSIQTMKLTEEAAGVLGKPWADRHRDRPLSCLWPSLAGWSWRSPPLSEPGLLISQVGVWGECGGRRLNELLKSFSVPQVCVFTRLVFMEVRASLIWKEPWGLRFPISLTLMLTSSRVIHSVT